jgi:hypothetical protein
MLRSCASVLLLGLISCNSLEYKAVAERIEKFESGVGDIPKEVLNPNVYLHNDYWKAVRETLWSAYIMGNPDPDPEENYFVSKETIIEGRELYGW